MILCTSAQVRNTWNKMLPNIIGASSFNMSTFEDATTPCGFEMLTRLLLITSTMIIHSRPCGPLCLGGSRHDIEPKETLTGQLSSNETHMRPKFAFFPQNSSRLFCQLVKS